MYKLLAFIISQQRSDLVELGVKIAVDDTRKVLDSPKPLETADDLLLGMFQTFFMNYLIR